MIPRGMISRILVLSLMAVFAAMGQPGRGMPGYRRGPLHGPGGMWWNNPEIVSRLGITADQQKRMDDIFQQSRPRLIDLRAALEKEDVVMEGLMKGPQLDDTRILPQIDRIAQARAELEKADARLLLALRHVLTPEQWQKLSEDGPRTGRGGPPPGAPHGRGGPPDGPAPQPRE